MTELTEAEARLRDRARELAREAAAQAAEIDRTEQYPWPMVRRMTEAGFFGLTIPRAYGGPGLSYFDAVLVIEEFAKACAVCGRIAVEANMGAIGAVMAYGTEAQKRLAAALVLAGDKPAICITEPEAGSAATEMTTRAVRHGDTWVIDGVKHWITGGGVSRLHLIFARAFEDGEEKGIGGFLVVRNGEGDPPGLIVHRRIPSMGLKGMPEAELHFRGLEVPDAMVLRPPGGFARGFGRLMEAYNGQRVGAATAALGIAAGAFDHALAFVQRREQFGRPIAEFQGLGWMLADMSIKLEASRALIWQAARSAGPGDGQLGFPDRLLAARAKVLAADGAIEVTNAALQLWGAAGYSRENPMERAVRDARMFAIAGGTAQVLRTQVAEQLLGRKLPQTRDGFLKLAARKLAAE
ncbi:acyl-CoA dehydrogenase family protein [Siccirubricoccus sp. KC 17139]|uniref:Acyl-CoA dehydrogenase family protein n=1 Tax=Siccirubricoccus soli TaxID=2899147 RepID=A0ABT1D9D0_9PROT|nr:3-sulfinopropanoyl-CoA desulfinase [Siccirubricoccus soli]MCO6418518.1 acyl-CoA dehydrogenase family protein [Siccirubricoccus soli]MCP2684653.1 acyl-CoA dehydrogenase family protein [Siccirubricoccus soli]